MDALLSACKHRCSTVWCKYFDDPFSVGGLSPSPATTNPCGYRNINNCCYANCVLRALFSLGDVCLDIEDSLTNFSDPLPTLFYLFVQLMRKSEADERKSVDFLHGQFIQHLHQLHVTFGGGRQQDASEFCLRLLDHFAETMPNVVPPVWRDHFESAVLQTLSCQRCGHSSETFQSVIHWDLPMSPDNHTIGKCMKHFLADEECQWDCSSCGGKKATMQKSVDKLPRVLMICLERFLNGQNIHSPIAFPDVWKPFTDEDGNSRNYALQAHVTHFGETVTIYAKVEGEMARFAFSMMTESAPNLGANTPQPPISFS